MPKHRRLVIPGQKAARQESPAPDDGRRVWAALTDVRTDPNGAISIMRVVTSGPLGARSLHCGACSTSFTANDYKDFWESRLKKSPSPRHVAELLAGCRGFYPCPSCFEPSTFAVPTPPAAPTSVKMGGLEILESKHVPEGQVWALPSGPIITGLDTGEVAPHNIR